MRKAKVKEQPKPEYPKVYESFDDPIGSMSYLLKEPSAFNGFVRIYRYKTTVEKIDEPIEVLQKRVQDLWDVCNNHHHWQPLQNTAKKLNYTITGSMGSKIPNLLKSTPNATNEL